MKKIVQFIFISVVAATALISCKKDEKIITFLGGKDPVLTATGNTSTQVINNAYLTQSSPAFQLFWTNPDYQFSTGISSQDVNYAIDIDTVGAKFTTAGHTILSTANDLTKIFSQKEINDHLINNLGLTVGTSYNIEVRVVASLTKLNSEKKISNIINFTVTPFQDPTLLPPDLYITGDGTPSGWTNNPPAAQKFTYIGNKTYEITMAFSPGFMYKFLTKPGQWQPQYGSASSTGGPLGLNDGTTSDPPAIPTPSIAGNYKITVNLAAPSFTIVKL